MKKIFHLLFTILLLTPTLVFAGQAEKNFKPDSNSYINKIRESTPQIMEAAIAGNSTAQSILADCYANGEGVKQDCSKAIYWYEKSAAQGDRLSAGNLGAIYFYEDGVRCAAPQKKNLNKAIFYFQLASKKGDARSQVLLGSLYMSGNGIEQDLVKAYAWLYAAIKNEDTDTGLNFATKEMVGKNLNMLFVNFNNDQKIQARKLGEEFKQKYSDPFVQNAY